MLLVENAAKGRIRGRGIGRSEIGMVEQVEKLQADREHPVFPAGDARVFQDRQVRGDVSRYAKPVAALRKRDARTAARPV